MKIGTDVTAIIYEGTGVGRYTKNLVENLLEIDKKSQYVLFGSSLRNRKALEDWFKETSYHHNVEKRFYKLPPSLLEFLWNSLHRVNLESFTGKVDVFHSWDWYQPPAAAKKVTTVHDLVVYKYPETSQPKIIGSQKRRLYWVKRECDLVLCDSEATKKDLVEELGFDEGKLRVIYPGIEKKFKVKNSKLKIQKIKEKYDLRTDYVLSVGTREPRKNLQRLLEAFKRIEDRGLRIKDRSIELVLVGKFGWGKDIEPVEGVRVLGYVPDEDLPALYAGAELFVYPSLYEGFGFPILEAMASGSPVVTSNRGSLKEVAGKAAVLVNPDEAESIRKGIIKVLSFRQKERLKQIEKGYIQAGKFSWERCARQTLGAYEELINSPS